MNFCPSLIVVEIFMPDDAADLARHTASIMFRNVVSRFPGKIPVFRSEVNSTIREPFGTVSTASIPHLEALGKVEASFACPACGSNDCARDGVCDCCGLRSCEHALPASVGSGR